MKFKRNFLDFFRLILIFSFFGIFVSSAFSAEKFWWNLAHSISEKDSVFPKTAGNGKKTFSFWQEVDKSDKNIWISARFLDSSGNWKILRRFAGPFEYAGPEIPDIYSAAMSKNGTLAVSVQNSDSELSVYVLRSGSEEFEKSEVSVPKGEFFAPRIYASFSGKFVMFASKSKISDSTLRLHEFFIFHSVSDDGIKWSPFVETFGASSMPNSFAPFMCSSEKSDFLVFQSQFSQENKNSYQIYVSHSENGGRSWAFPVIVTGKDSVPKGDFSDFDNQAPFILFKNGKINLLWERKSRGTENSEIWYEQILDGKVLPESVDVVASKGNCRKAGLFDFKDEIYAFWFDNRSGYEQVYLAEKQKIDWEESRLSQQKIDSTFPSPLINGDDLSFVWQSKNSAVSARNSTETSGAFAENRIMSLEPDKEVSAATIISERQGANSTFRSKNRRVSFKIKLPYDISGIQGYTFSWSQDDEEKPPLEKKSLSDSQVLQLSAEKEGYWYLKVCVLDNAGNWSKISSAEYYLDLTPPRQVVFEPLETDSAGFLSSNSGIVRWHPDFLDDDIKGYSYGLSKIAEIPAKFSFSSKNRTKVSEEELKNYAEKILGADEKSFQRKIKLSGAVYKNPVFAFKNQRNGLYILSVAAVDEAGFVGEPKNIPVLLNKYVPHTYISSIKENVSSFGDIAIELSGNDFAYDGTVRSVIVDSDGKPPYDFVASKDVQDFSVSNSKISGINLGHELDEGSYFVGVVHSTRGISFTKTKALKISPNGTVQIENEYEYVPSWKAVEKKYAHSVFVGYIVLFIAGILLVVAIFVFGISFFKNYAEICSAKRIVIQLESGGLMPQFQKSKKERRRNGSLKTSLAGFAISLVVAIIIVISLSLGFTMIKGQERTLSKGLHDRVNVLLSSVFTGARTYLQNADENTMEFNDLLNQMSSLSEAEFLTITGGPAKNYAPQKNSSGNNEINENNDEKNSVLYVWASNDANITSKVDRLSARKTIIPGVSKFSSAQELEQEILQRCSELNLEAYELCGKTEEKIAGLNSEISGATNSRRMEISNLNAGYRSEIQRQLLALSEKGSDSLPSYNDEKFNRNVTEYLFYRPVLYSAGASDQKNQYVHGILFLKVNTDSLIRDVDNATRNIFYIVLVLSAIAIVLGILGANLFAGRIVRPIQLLEKTVTEISEENDKERLLAGDITDLPNNEIGRLGDSVNRMKKDLGYNERELNLQANEATPIQQAMVSLEPLSGNFKQNVSRISDKNISEFAYYKGASGASGDYFDFKKLDERWYVLIKCDASGHAAPAGILVTIVATLYKKYFESWSYQKNGTKLEDFIYKVNGFLESLNIKGKFVAMIVSLYDSKTGDIFMCHAGDRFVRIYENSTESIKKIELAETPAAGPFPNFMLELKGGFKVEQTKLNQKDVLILYTDGIEENGRVIRTPDFAAVLKPKTDSNGEQICDEYGNPEFEAEREEFGEKRIYEIIEAVFQKKKYILTKKDNPSAGEILEFDFTNCQGTVEEATLALASLEKLFRLYKPTSATVKDLVEVDVAIDGFLKKYFSLYKEYAVPPTQESFHGRPVRKPKNPNNVFYSCIKEDSQEDDLTIVCLQRN